MAHRVDKDLSIITDDGESLWLRRRALGLTTTEAARRLGVGRTALYLAERGLARLDARLEGRFGLPELLALARRRSGWTLREAARRAKVSHVTLLRMEERADDRLVRFWEGRGFTFARGRS